MLSRNARHAECQQVGQPGVEQGVVEGLGVAQLAEERSEALHALRVEAARVPTDRVTLEQGPGVG